MFGANPARAQEIGDGHSLWIQEVFYTLQGEGPFSGEPSVFVRTGGCNLKCFWCDTDFESSTWRPSLADLLQRIDAVRPRHCDLIVLTGGEPFRQNIAPLVAALLDRGLRVQLETNGTLWIDLPWSDKLTVVCSPKTRRLDERLIPHIDAYKYVIGAGETDPSDGLPTASTQHGGLHDRLFRAPAGASVFVMPRDDHPEDPVDRSDGNLQAARDAALTFGYRFCLQLHKAIGVD
ncbi:MAG: 7-carboxy-7-deazaguanine synthase QueE [Caulobacteraceae bacterium]